MSAIELTAPTKTEPIQEREPASAPRDLSALLGHWINTNTPAVGFRQIELAEREDRLELHAEGAPGLIAGDWGRTRADTVYANDPQSSAAIAFTARYELGVADCLVQANQSLGLLIIAQLCRFPAPSGRASCFAREFYRRTARSLAKLPPPSPSDRPPGRPAGALDAGAFTGTWINTHAATRGMARMEINSRSEGLFVRIHGAEGSSPHEWNETRADTFGGAGSGSTLASFSTRHDFDDRETRLHTWVKQGVLVAARFDRFPSGSGRANQFSREFFYRVDTNETSA